MTLHLARDRVLADSSIWIDHLRRHHARFGALVENESIIIHDFVIGELGLGAIARGHPLLDELTLVPRAVHPTHEEVLAFIRRSRLEGAGIGWVDAHLLVAALASGALLWTLDRRLALAARTVGALFT